MRHSIDELKRANDRHVQRQKQFDKDLLQTTKELRSFQTEKQVALNQLDVVVPLTLKQLHCLDYDAAPEGGWPSSLVVDAVMGSHVLMTTKDLHKLDQRTKELEDEIKAEKHNFKVSHLTLTGDKGEGLAEFRIFTSWPLLVLILGPHTCADPKLSS